MRSETEIKTYLKFLTATYKEAQKDPKCLVLPELKCAIAALVWVTDEEKENMFDYV